MKNILTNLKDYNDIKKLNINELNCLCEEIREFLVENVSKTGGHLASNLGIVELTIAIHKVFDLPKDKLIFDVGHQSYVHKILTGRSNEFDTLRQFGGLSGFPKRSESIFDSFNTGHSSTSVSAALGMARARDLLNEDYKVIALFGDGALTGGEIYEAMNDAGNAKTPLTLILNDNEMSISKNVGAVSKHLRRIRVNHIYFKYKRKISHTLNHIPIVGKPIYSCMEKVKNILRSWVLRNNLFESIGYKYIGPIDGHDVNALISCLEYAKSQTKPTLVHVCTHKGKGYAPAEKNPSSFHGVGKFSVDDGIVPESNDSYSAQFGRTLTDMAKTNQHIVAITCAMLDGTGLVNFAKEFPDRCFDVGIAEQHGVTFAAGLAVSGFTPVIPLYSTFLQRAYDQMLHDVCLQHLHVVFPIDRAGIVGADGETHQGIYDISYIASMPDMTLLSPSSFKQLDEMLRYAINEYNGPIAIRYPRGKTESPYEPVDFEIGKSYVHAQGDDVLIFATGRMVNRANEVYNILANKDIKATVVECPTIFPMNEADIINRASNSRYIYTIEDNIISGGFGEHIGHILISNEISCKFKAFGFPQEPITHGTINQLDKKYGLDAVSIASVIEKDFTNGKN